LSARKVEAIQGGKLPFSGATRNLRSDYASFGPCEAIDEIEHHYFTTI